MNGGASSWLTESRTVEGGETEEENFYKEIWYKFYGKYARLMGF